jgi:ankyrin repeat protein
VEKEQYISFVGFIDYFSEFSLNWQDDRGRTALHRAVADRDKTIVELLLDSKLRASDQTLDLNIVDEDGYSPLGLALRDENHDLAARLLDQTRHRLYVETGSGKYASLLHLAVTKLDVKSVVKLIMRDVNVDIKDPISGDTPLHCLIGHYLKNLVAARKILEFLIQSGADVNS